MDGRRLMKFYRGDQEGEYIMSNKVRKFVATATELFKSGDLAHVADELARAFPEVPDSVIVDYVFAHRAEIQKHRK